jgi:hypothetical protein
MDLPQWLTGLLLVVLGHVLTRVLDRFAGTRPAVAVTEDEGIALRLSSTGRQRLLERREHYVAFRRAAQDVVHAASVEGHGSYGSLYRVRDAYGNVLRSAPAAVTQAADSVIRCVTLLVNLGASDERYAMFTRALRNYDEACEDDHGLGPPVPAPLREEFGVVGRPREVAGGEVGRLRELQPRR